MRGTRFREALAAYLFGLVVAHLRLLSVWSVTAARLHFWVTEDRGEIPPSLATYRTDETALQLYAESLAGENDRLRWTIRWGLWGIVGLMITEIQNRLIAFGRVILDLVRGLALAMATVTAVLVVGGLFGWGVDIVFRDLPEIIASLRTPDRPDAGVPRHARAQDRYAELCMVEPPRFVLRFTSWERAPRLIPYASLNPYWLDATDIRPRYAFGPIEPLRDCGGEIFPPPCEKDWLRYWLPEAAPGALVMTND